METYHLWLRYRLYFLSVPFLFIHSARRKVRLSFPRIYGTLPRKPESTLSPRFGGLVHLYDPPQEDTSPGEDQEGKDSFLITLTGPL
jgi:hypothetical protein